jgi:hypothetical protein
MVTAVDRRVTDTWLDLVCNGGPESEPLRRALAERWAPPADPPAYWMRLKAELREMAARLEDADDARYVRGDLDSRRHAVIVEKLTIKIKQVEDALATAEPRIDTTPLRDRSYVTARWGQHTPAGRRNRDAYGQSAVSDCEGAAVDSADRSEGTVD